MERSSGVLMPISALPSRYGIGTLGREAREFADFLAASGQRVWQVLPLGPTGYGDSPYSSFSTCAGNPYFIDLEDLCARGLLESSLPDAADWGDDPGKIDYGKIYALRLDILRRAYEAGYARDAEAVAAFEAESGRWLPDYALYMALKRRFDMRPWTEWPDEDIRLRKPESLARYARELSDDVRFFTYVQFLFYRQWGELRDYVHSLDIKLIGDLPIYVALDSADVWAEPGFFLLDEKNVPTEVSGVPPDYFCEDGQLWGNPIYRWDEMRADGYGWWIRRIDGARKLYDILRIDHFRGLESYWSIPFGAESAKTGKWVKGPGMDLLRVLRSWFPEVSFIAEDLGFMTDGVKKLLSDSGFPGMKVLEFAFDPREPSNYLPHTYERQCVCYIGTHDNETLVEWLDTVAPENLELAGEYLGLSEAEGKVWGFIRGGMGSVADLFVAQMQDLLELGAEARMNIPGTSQGNWRWRMLPGQAGPQLSEKLLKYTKMYGRI